MAPYYSLRNKSSTFISFTGFNVNQYADPSGIHLFSAFTNAVIVAKEVRSSCPAANFSIIDTDTLDFLASTFLSFLSSSLFSALILIGSHLLLMLLLML